MFVDFEKAFDNVSRKALWLKLLSNNINGKMYDIINNIYSQIKSRIVYNHEFSKFLNCGNGVRQGKKYVSFLVLHLPE